MRSYIRHPSDVPIEVIPEENAAPNSSHQLQNFSHGGLSFISQATQKPGSLVKIRIPFVQPPFETVAIVKWCNANAGQYEIGVEFFDANDEFKVRMVEQICHIEHYKNEVLIKEGRKLSGQEAALEWIEKFAGDFPLANSEDKAVNH